MDFSPGPMELLLGALVLSPLYLVYWTITRIKRLQQRLTALEDRRHRTFHEPLTTDNPYQSPTN